MWSSCFNGDRGSGPENIKNSRDGWRFCCATECVQRRGRRTLHSQGRQPVPLQMTTLARSLSFPKALTL